MRCALVYTKARVAKYAIEFHPAASAEAENTRAWYADRNQIAAEGFLAELDHAVAQIVEGPERWPTFRLNTRRYPNFRSV